MNVYLKEIVDLCGIIKCLIIYVVCYIVVIIVFFVNDVLMENVFKILGYFNIRMIQYYVKVLDSFIMCDMVNVEKNFKQKKNYVCFIF